MSTIKGSIIKRHATWLIVQVAQRQGRRRTKRAQFAEHREESASSAVVLTQPFQSLCLRFAAWHPVLKRETISLTTVTHSLPSDPDGQHGSAAVRAWAVLNRWFLYKADQYGYCMDTKYELVYIPFGVAFFIISFVSLSKFQIWIRVTSQCNKYRKACVSEKRDWHFVYLFLHILLWWNIKKTEFLKSFLLFGNNCNVAMIDIFICTIVHMITCICWR